ncbi:hypothetical protein C0993_006603 [Termitomyces sp. T159_Od127]|nr:hypothetical protein C0993_006603 [Termitomyces sp. T159_Od127]
MRLESFGSWFGKFGRWEGVGWTLEVLDDEDSLLTSLCFPAGHECISVAVCIQLPTQETVPPSMIIPKQNRRTIYENLFKEGVLVAKKDYNAPKHEELDVPNLHVIKALQSLTSKGYVKTQFSWQWYYYVLTPEGVEYLREWCVKSIRASFDILTRHRTRLHLPNEIVPATHKKAARPPRPATVRSGGEGAYRAPRGDREDYRKKEGGAPGEFRPQFAGVGRGAPRE